MPLRQAAGGIVVRRDGGRVLLALTIEEDDGGTVVALPKGGLEPGEDAVTAARREVFEETGLSELRLVLNEPLHVEARYGLGKGVWIKYPLFLFETIQTTGVPTDPRHRLAWFPLNALPPLFWPGEANMLARLDDRIMALLEV
ncbi:NUDIX domain-containing protein (plasmid) [Deinococcus radiomollis]